MRPYLKIKATQTDTFVWRNIWFAFIILNSFDLYMIHDTTLEYNNLGWLHHQQMLMAFTWMGTLTSGPNTMSISREWERERQKRKHLALYYLNRRVISSKYLQLKSDFSAHRNTAAVCHTKVNGKRKEPHHQHVFHLSVVFFDTMWFNPEQPNRKCL